MWIDRCFATVRVFFLVLPAILIRVFFLVLPAIVVGMPAEQGVDVINRAEHRHAAVDRFCQWAIKRRFQTRPVHHDEVGGDKSLDFLCGRLVGVWIRANRHQRGHGGRIPHDLTHDIPKNGRARHHLKNVLVRPFRLAGRRTACDRHGEPKRHESPR